MHGPNLTKTFMIFNKNCSMHAIDSVEAYLLSLASKFIFDPTLVCYLEHENSSISW